MRRRAWLLGVGALAFVPLRARQPHWRLIRAMAPGSNVSVRVPPSIAAALPTHIDDVVLDELRVTQRDAMHALEEALRHALYA